MANLDYALLYANKGWHVVPLHTPHEQGCSCGDDKCTHIGKHPRLRNWQQRASTNETQIREWWEQWPDANIGIVTGQASGLLVLDNDTGHLDISEAERVPCVSTGRGYHLYYQHPGGKIANRFLVTAGCDIRSDGGLVVAPPSLHASGKRYAWVSDPSLPLSLPPAELLIEINQNDTNWCQTSSPAQGGGTTGYVAAALAGEIARVRNAREGQRNDQLNRAAFALGTLIGGGELDAGEAEAQLLGAAQQVGLGETEARRTIASGLAAGRARPRTVAPAAAPDKGQQEQQEQLDLHSWSPAAYISERIGMLDPQFLIDCLTEEEYGDAKVLARLYSGRLCYDHAEKCWYVWGGHAWYRDRTLLIRHLIAGQLARQYLLLAAENSRDASVPRSQIETATKRALRLRTLQRCNNIGAFAQSFMGITGENWDRNPWLLGVANGVLDLRTGKMRHGQPGDYIRTIAPTTWRGIDEPAPRFEQFISEIFDGNEAIITFVQRLLGYSITGLTVEHIFPVLWGERGRNGKDTLLETLKAVLGDCADTVSTDVLLAQNSRGNAQPHLIDLMGKRLVWASETSVNARLNEAQVKLVTGGGTIKARPLYGAMLQFAPTHLVLLITNHKPRANAEDDALWNRIVLLPFNLRFVANPTEPDERQRDPHLRQKLAEERSGILAWLVRGCLAWQGQGLAIPDEVRAQTDSYREEEDLIGQFIEECCVVQQNATCPAKSIYEAYREWAENAGMNPLNQINFGKKLGKRFERKRLESRFLYVGIGLSSLHPDPSDPSDPFLQKVLHESDESSKLSCKMDQDGSGSEAPIQDMPSQRDIYDIPAKTNGSGMDQDSPPPGQGQEGDEPGQGQPGQGQPGQGQQAVIPPAVVFRRNINDERRDLISAARALLRERGAPAELATYDCEGMSVAQLKRLIEELEGRPKTRGARGQSAGR